MLDGRAHLVSGASGSGKTSWTMQQCARDARLLVWDALGEWCRRAHLTNTARLSELANMVARSGSAPRFRVAYTGPVTREHFATFCAIAWAWLRARPGTLVVEELADVTSPGKAPTEWGEIVRKGRHTGAQVYALTQRPAESDKTILGNAALIHAGLCSSERDRVYIARCLDVPEGEVRALRQLQWIERDMRSRELRRGVVKFRR